MSRIFVIAKNTLREAIRDRVLYGILAFGALYILLTIFLGKLALGNLVMIRSFGLAGVYLFGLTSTIFLGSSILYTEIERRTLYFVLSKPVSRGEVIVGKFVGLFSAVTLATVLMTVLYLVVIFCQGGGFDAQALLAVALQLVEMAIFTALLLCLSAAVAPLTATISAIMVLFTGHLLDAVLVQGRQIGGATYVVSQVLHFTLPNLEKFNIRDLVAHNTEVPPLVLLVTVAYGLLYATGLLYAAWLLFRRREL